MIALPTPPPPLFPKWVWSFESADDQYPSVSHRQNSYFSTTDNYDYRTTQTTAFDLTVSHGHLGGATADESNNDNGVMGMKKLHHNASERDRRKKMNTLYSFLRSLLPATDHKKKMSIPTTVGRVVKYIPELQEEVQKLMAKKEKLIGIKKEIKIDGMDNDVASTCLPSISLNRVGNGELVMQIPLAAQNVQGMSQLLLSLEEDRLLLLNASSFQSHGSTMLFYNLHFQVKDDFKVGYEDLNKKLSSLLKRKEMVFPRAFAN